MKKLLFLLFCFFILLAIIPDASAQGFPCVVRGMVTVNNVPTADVFVTVTSNSNCTTNSSGYYDVVAQSGDTVVVTATYQGYNQTLTVNTPATGGFVDDQNINIKYVKPEQDSLTLSALNIGEIPYYKLITVIGIIVFIMVFVVYMIFRKS